MDSQPGRRRNRRHGIRSGPGGALGEIADGPRARRRTISCPDDVLWVFVGQPLKVGHRNIDRGAGRGYRSRLGSSKQSPTPTPRHWRVQPVRPSGSSRCLTSTPSRLRETPSYPKGYSPRFGSLFESGPERPDPTSMGRRADSPSSPWSRPASRPTGREPRMGSGKRGLSRAGACHPDRGDLSHRVRRAGVRWDEGGVANVGARAASERRVRWTRSPHCGLSGPKTAKGRPR